MLLGEGAGRPERIDIRDPWPITCARSVVNERTRVAGQRSASVIGAWVPRAPRLPTDPVWADSMPVYTKHWDP